MKKISLLLLCCAFLSFSWAQMPDGSYAPDFSLYEINKSNGQLITDHAYTLYEYTNAGKPVFLDFFANWCSPCWNYHNSGAFEGLYNQYGPTGTDEVMVFGIEGSNGNYANLTSPLNWLNGVPYPMCPTAMSPNSPTVVNNYQIGYFPTVYMVCPTRQVYQVGQEPTATLYSSINQLCPQYQTELTNNACIFDVRGIKTVYHCEASVTPVVRVQNVGVQDMTSFQLTINYDGQTSTQDWTGSKSQYDVAEITLPTFNETVNGNHTYTVSITKINGVDDADATDNVNETTFNVQVQGTTVIDEDFSDQDYTQSWYCKNNLLAWFNQAVYFNCYNIPQGETDELYIPLMDLSGYTNPTLKFDVAHARYNAGTTDRLKVRVSTNCGSSWRNAYNKADPDLATANNSSSIFTPNSSQWRTETVDLTEFKGDQVLAKFAFTSGYGNTIWIDNVKLVEGTGIENQDNEFSIYPNPAASVLNIRSNAQVEKVEIYNMQGQMVGLENGNVQSINVSNLTAGSYILRVSTVDGVLNQMFVKE